MTGDDRPWTPEQPAPDALRAAAQAVVEHRAGEHGVVAYSCGLRLDDHIAALRAALEETP